MFGISLTKILLTLFIVVAVWYGFKYVQRMQERQMASRDRVKVHRHEATRPREKSAPAEVEDMIECRVCGAFVPQRGAAACGRVDCPYPG